MATITLEGRVKSLKFYTIPKSVVVDDDDFDSQYKLNQLYERVQEYIDSGEIENFSNTTTINTLSFDDLYFAIDDKEVNIDETNLKNKIPKEHISEINRAKEGDLIALYVLEGEGRWDIEVDANNIQASSLNIDYIDCSDYFEESELLLDKYLDLMCDTILPDTLRAKNKKNTLNDFYLDPTQSYMELYKVIKIDGVNILEKLDSKGRVLSGTDFIIDDFEEN